MLKKWSPRSKRMKHYLAQHGLCCYCEKPMRILPYNVDAKDKATVEHLKRRADGGDNSMGNTRLACKDCNTRRHGHSWLEWKSICMGEI